MKQQLTTKEIGWQLENENFNYSCHVAAFMKFKKYRNGYTAIKKRILIKIQIHIKISKTKIKKIKQTQRERT